MSQLDSNFAAEATIEGDVVVNISYDIIRQFSAQLYTNPRKAIEELVCNSYDAGATECFVKLPKDPDDSLVVLDNGKSMDLKGLKDLWMVAKSPKVDDKLGRRIANHRLQIGKFGVGKLAAYALGRRLIHVATVNGMTRLVSVDEEEIKEQTSGGAPHFDVYMMKADRAQIILEPFLGELPKPWENNWPSWTMAVVENVEERNIKSALKVGMLRRMISTALPISDDFKVILEGEAVALRSIEPDNIELTVPVYDPEFRKKLETNLQNYWKEKLGIEKVEDVPEKLYRIKPIKILSPNNTQIRLNAIDVPELGPIEGSAILTKRTLTTDKLGERGYKNHGFAIYANGKLVNPEDELFGISPRSHATWNRFLARVEIPGLDSVLLVQRNAISENSPQAQVAREVMLTLFNYTRTLAEAKEESEDFVPEAFGSKIGKLTPFLAPIAIAGLGEGKLPENGIAKVDIDFVTLTDDGPAVRYDRKGFDIQVNLEHPVLAALEDLHPKEQKRWRQVLGEIVAGGKLAVGLLISKGIIADIIHDVEELIDASLRSAASYIRDPVNEYIREIEEASYIGGTRFENAVVNAFRNLRLVAWRIGGSDNPDGIVKVPISGAKNLLISIEAKGTKGIISHTELMEATVDRQRKEAGCTHAVAIAREYQVDGRSGGDSALLRETEGKLPLLTVSAIALMLRLHQKRPFTYDQIRKILTTWTHPDKLEEFIEKTWREFPEEVGLMRLILEVAHEKTVKHERNYPDPGMLVDDSRLERFNVSKKQIMAVLDAVAVTTRMITIINTDNYEFSMTASVETILEAMTRASEEEVPIETKTPSDKKRDK